MASLNGSAENGFNVKPSDVWEGLGLKGRFRTMEPDTELGKLAVVTYADAIAIEAARFDAAEDPEHVDFLRAHLLHRGNAAARKVDMLEGIVGEVVYELGLSEFATPDVAQAKATERAAFIGQAADLQLATEKARLASSPDLTAYQRTVLEGFGHQVSRLVVSEAHLHFQPEGAVAV